MSPAAHTLPSTRLIRRRSTSRGWLVGVGLTIALNLALVVGLAQASHLAADHVEPPQPVRRIQRAEAPPPPLEPPPRTRPRPTEAQPSLPTVALPALDLPAAPADAGLELPSFATTGDMLTLPDTVPAFAAFGDETTLGDGIEPGPRLELAFDEPPTLLAALDLRRFYPRQALVRRIEGETVLRLELDASGAVRQSSIVSSVPSGVFDDAAERITRQLRFSPAKRAGQAVPAIFTQTIHWTIER